LECGDDGCGGTCGSCGAGDACEDSECAQIAVSVDTVFGIFERSSCANTGCHSASRRAEKLDLSSASALQADLVDVASTQCGDRKRVLPGEPAQSYLINKLTGVGMCSGAQMPKGKPALSAADIEVVRTWIRGL
jgi:hypothetical protein